MRILALDSQLHLGAGFVMIVIFSCVLFCCGKIKGAHFLSQRNSTITIAILLAIVIMCAKEIYDVVFNPWSLSSMELFRDLVKDLFCGLIGLVFGVLVVMMCCWWWKR